jgi:hypothetical protein
MKRYIRCSYHYDNNQVVYHGGRQHISADEFNTNIMPCFFTAIKEYAESYGTVVTAYRLQLNNPFVLDNPQAVDIYNNEFIPYADKKHWSDGWSDNLRTVSIGDKISFVVADYLYPFLRRMKRKGVYNYDGIICSEGNSYYDESYIPFDTSQISEVN